VNSVWPQASGHSGALKPSFSPWQDLPEALGWGLLICPSYVLYLDQYTEPFPVGCHCRWRIFNCVSL